ncbi:MAG: cyclodeaminase/cyclohydrolase family protein [Thermoleophilia bacterium]|nr:cyclodeaminase/cyclohydrolase family protein [Thermoleophilia bacterium]
METTLTAYPLRELEVRVASADPTPGGGSVSALAGALGAALGTMVWRLTQAKGSSDLPEERLADLAVELEELAAALNENVDRDAASYEGVIAALRLPKATDGEKAARRAAIEAATRVATEVPLETARLCAQVMERCLAAARLGHAGAVTDAGVGLLMASAGVAGALYNVEINLGGLTDQTYTAAVAAEAAALRERAEGLRHEGDQLVRRRLAE